MAVCARCGAEIPPGIFTYEGDDGKALCARCFRRNDDGPPVGGGALARGLAFALRVSAVAGLAGGVVLARLGAGGGPLLSGVGLALGAGLFLGCLALAELLRLGLSAEMALRGIADALDRIDGDLRRGGDADGPLE